MPKEKKTQPITCSICHRVFTLSTTETACFCPLCGNVLNMNKLEKAQNHQPDNSEFFSDRYQLIKNIGKGGMGEVFLAFDTLCARSIALKRIRPDLIEHPQIRHRFLKEAHITCQLTHPAIIPIYSIQAFQLSAYYTMPFVEGETLKQIIRKARQQEKRGEPLDHVGSSIPALMRIFITICQAVAYAHAKGVLHRDLKPENIIIGKYGEVLILDWGLAKYIDSSLPEDEEDLSQTSTKHKHHQEITRVGKVVGTVAYMAPERALGQQATIQTDIYALGVILYQLLTLKNPFRRGTLEEFRKKISKEKYIDPVIAAPYRDVPRMLARVTDKCLNRNPQKRYREVGEIIRDMETYLEGRSEWFFVGELDIKRKTDWEFQEHVLIAEHVAITHITEEAEWVNLMISKQSFNGNTQIEFSIRLHDQGHGIGILFSVPEFSERTYINDGYCLWLGSDQYRSTKLLRSNVEVLHASDIFLKRDQLTLVRIEKIDKSIHLYLDDVLQFTYSALLPLIGTHVGILSRDANFEIESLKISVGSLNLTVNCLAVPDAFLAQRDFTQALSEYRRIAYSFPDRAEGREALFRAGLTFIEQSKGTVNKNDFLDQALQEFEKLHGTPGGPLEYLGKALVYQALNEEEEEIKCFALAFRRYPKHPLLAIIQEQILSRMHEVSRLQRINAYRFILLAARNFPLSAIDTHTRRLFTSLQKYWERLPFIEEQTSKDGLSFLQRLAIPIAFWLAEPYTLGEILDDLLKNETPNEIEIGNALASLIELGAWKYAESKMEQMKNQMGSAYDDSPLLNDIQMMSNCHSEPLKNLFHTFFSHIEQLNFSNTRCLLYMMDLALHFHQTSLIITAHSFLKKFELSYDTQLQINLRLIWAYLLDKNWQQAGEVIYFYPIELLNQESSLLHFLYGCWLQATEGKEIAMIHFSGLLHVTYPRTWTLASHELLGDLLTQGWLDKAFLWEKRQLYRQLSLFYHCSGEKDKSEFYFQLYQKQFVNAET